MISVGLRGVPFLARRPGLFVCHGAPRQLTNYRERQAISRVFIYVDSLFLCRAVEKAVFNPQKVAKFALRGSVRDRTTGGRPSRAGSRCLGRARSRNHQPAAVHGMMGWWRPFFFFDLSGVQILIAPFVLDGPLSWLLAAGAIASLCWLDRSLASLLSAPLRKDSEPRSDNAASALFMGQRCTGGLIMLLLMSFNAIVFAYTILALGLAERASLWRRRLASGPGMPAI